MISIFAVVGLVAGWRRLSTSSRSTSPRRCMRDAQDEITGWEARWTAARACLLGATPGVVEDQRGARDPRDDARSVGPRRLHAAASASCRAAKARHRAPRRRGRVGRASSTPRPRRRRVRDARRGGSRQPTSIPLPAALDALDAARGKLRAAAGLPADDRTPTRPLPVVEVVPLDDGTEPVTEVVLGRAQTRWPPSAHGARVRSATPRRMQSSSARLGGAPKVARIAPRSVRAVPDVELGGDGRRLHRRRASLRSSRPGDRPADSVVQAGSINAEGAMSDAGDPDHQPRKPDSSDALVVAAALGGARRCRRGRLAAATARSRSPSCKGAAPAILRVDDESGFDVRGHRRPAVVVWRADSHEHAQLIKPGSLGRGRSTIPPPGSARRVFSRDRAWLHTEGSRSRRCRDDKLGPAAGRRDHAEVGCGTGTSGAIADAAVIATAASRRTRSAAATRAAGVDARRSRARQAVRRRSSIGTADRDRVPRRRARRCGAAEESRRVFYGLPPHAVRLSLTHTRAPRMALTDGKAISST